MKRLHRVTPIFCGDYSVLDANLGVMQDGQGGASIQDIDLEIPEPMVAELAKALENKTLQVEITYSTHRVAFCGQHEVLDSFKVINHENQKIPQAQVVEKKEVSATTTPSNFQTKCLELAKSVSDLEKCKAM